MSVIHLLIIQYTYRFYTTLYLKQLYIIISTKFDLNNIPIPGLLRALFSMTACSYVQRRAQTRQYETGTNVTRTTKKTPLTTYMKGEEWRFFCPFCLNLTSFPTFLTLQDKHKIRTLSLNIKFICTRCETGLKSSPMARYSACF